MTDIIRFYRTTETHGFLSNFWVSTPILQQGHVFKTSEHLYQALKFSHEADVFELIRDAKSARIAADLGRKSQGMREDWDDVKLFAMRLALLLKFEDFVARTMLLDTGDAMLVEHTPDAYWGDGGGPKAADWQDAPKEYQGPGLNMLGKLLGEVRAFYNELKDVSPHEEAAEISDLQAEICARLRTKQYPVIFPKARTK